MQIHTQKDQKEIKSHGNYAFPVNVCVESIQAYEQDSFLWHWHPEIELTWVIRGTMEYQVNDRRYILEEGEGLFGNSNTLHSGYRIGEEECDYLTITFHPRFLYGYENSVLQTKFVNWITTNDRWSSLKLGKDKAWHQELVSNMKEIYELSQNQPEDYEMEVHMILMHIWQRLYQYYKELPEKEYPPQRHLQRIRDIITYVDEHYDQEISLDDIADYVNICKSECCRFFKKHMNMTIFEYILFFRIQKSLPLLKAGESVTKTADLVGFSSPAYYGQIFRRYMHCSPREYAKSN